MMGFSCSSEKNENSHINSNMYSTEAAPIKFQVKDNKSDNIILLIMTCLTHEDDPNTGAKLN